MGALLQSGGVALPAPVSLSVNNEIIWSSDTGRLLDGIMSGDVVAEKSTVSIKWGILTETEMKLIRSKLIAGFFPFTFRDDGLDITIESYRGTLSKEHLGYIGDGIYYYKSAAVEIIQR